MNRKKYPTSLVLFARIFIGGYLVYTAYGVYEGSKSAENPRALFLILAVVFAVAGILAAVFSLRELVLGRYDGGPGCDKSLDDEEAEKADNIVDADDFSEEKESFDNE